MGYTGLILNILRTVQSIETSFKIINHLKKWYNEGLIIGTVGGGDSEEEEDEG